VELLAEHGEMPAGRVAEHFDMTRAAVSRHLKTLEAGGFVVVREDAQRRLYRLNPAPFVEMDAWLARYWRFWGEKFATLDRSSKRQEWPTSTTTTSPTWPVRSPGAADLGRVHEGIER
jgi:DNA-binding transcriptional ArsR family regulator